MSMTNHQRLFSSIIAGLLLLTGCSHKTDWADNPRQLLSEKEIQTEITIKTDRVNSFLDAEGIQGMLLTQVRNVYWMTAGLANNQIVLNNDVGAASLLIMRNGKKYLICKGSEAGRLMDESLGVLGYELAMFNWYESNPKKDVRGAIIAELAGDSVIGSDTNFPGTVLKSNEFAKLRYSLTDPEIKRYKWLGRETTEAVEQVCRTLKPGMNEFEIEYMTARALRSRGIFPTVLLIGVDERIYKYRHVLAGGAKLKNYAMVNVVAEKWGMSMAVTRFVHFGPLPVELASKLQATARINALYEISTVPGKALAEIFEECKIWYADAGYEGEWRIHHQGGATGYQSREVAIYPGIEGTVQENQAFAWNPTITGAKIEDTIIVDANGFEVLTKSADWPMISVMIDGRTYLQPDILVR